MTHNGRPRVFLGFYVVGAGHGLVSNYWLEPLTRTLRDEMDCDVVVPKSMNLGAAYGRLDRSWIQEQRPRMSEALLREFYQAHREKPIDLFLSYFTASHIEPAALKEIRKVTPCVNFFCDNLQGFSLVEELTSAVTLNWVAERRACETYRARGLPYIYLPMAACPSYHRPAEGEAEDLDVTFCGSFQLPRLELFGEALRRGLEIEVFGAQTDMWVAPPRQRSLLQAARDGLQWLKVRIGNCLKRGLDYDLYWLRMEQVRRRYRDYPHRLLHPSLPDDEVFRLYARSKVSVGVNRIWLPGSWFLFKSRWYAYPRLRDFEATMAGACYLTEYAEEHDDLFDIGTEIEVYRNSDELVEKAKRLLADPARRAQLRHHARQGALSRHTWRHRLEKIFAAVGVSWRPRSTAPVG